jgi:3-oxoacyl-[acyl-carrier protein] reductase
MDLGLSGRTAIVPGASQGMGLAIAETLRAEGANVVMAARRADVLTAEAERIGALPVPTDLLRAEDRERLVSAALERFGAVDVLVLNGAGPPAGPAVGLAPEQVIAAVELLLVPHVHLVDLCLPHLRSSGRGRIVAIQSTSVRQPIPNLALSNAVRPGVVGWLKTLASELASDGITVNTIAPGNIATERLLAIYRDDGPPLDEVPAGRVGTAGEVAAVACFLASEQAAYVTGALIPVDGGLIKALA